MTASSPEWAERFKLSTSPFDEWRTEATSGKSPAERDNRALSSGSIDDPLAKGGPVPSVNIVYSFDDEKPATVALELFWPPERPA